MTELPGELVSGLVNFLAVADGQQSQGAMNDVYPVNR